ncbi:MAG: hypothetical protein ED557_14055 [Balneola sp.]|nr:MAG: hypothetical protein ED557_14055 [Balneola sp.]
MFRIILFTISAIILAWLTFRIIYARKKRMQYENVFLEVFENIQVELPEFKIDYKYGYPSFEVIFKNQEDLKVAESKGSTEKFKDMIQILHKNIDDFEAELAIHYTWKTRTYSSNL